MANYIPLIFMLAILVGLAVRRKNNPHSCLVLKTQATNNSDDDRMLDEPHIIKLGWQLDWVKVTLIGILASFIILEVNAFRQIQHTAAMLSSSDMNGLFQDMDRLIINDQYQHFYGVLGVFAVSILFFVAVFWCPWRRGKIVIDRVQLVVPRFFSVQTFSRTTARVEIRTFGHQTHACRVRDGSQSATFYANAKTAELLRIWASIPTIPVTSPPTSPTLDAPLEQG